MKTATFLSAATATVLTVAALIPAPAFAACTVTDTGANTVSTSLTVGQSSVGAYGLDGSSCSESFGSVIVGASSGGDGTLRIENGASLATSLLITAFAGNTVGNTSILTGAQVNVATDCEVSSTDGAATDSGVGVMTVSGEGTNLSCGDELQVGYDGPGSLEVSDGADLTALRMTSAFEGPGEASIRVQSGARLEITGTSGASHTFGVRKSGILDIDGGTLAFTDGGGTLTTCTVGGQCSVEVRVANGGLLSNEALIVADNDTTVSLDGGTIETQISLRMLGQSLLQGSGTISGPLDNRADLLPGFDGIGRIDIVSDMMQGTAGDVSHARGATMEMEIAGESSFDELVLDGNLTFAGNLQVQFIDNYEPALGTRFAIISAGGNVDYNPFSVSLSGLSPALEAETTVFAENGEIVVAVPEPAPSSMAFAVFTALGLVCLRRRQVRRLL